MEELTGNKKNDVDLTFGITPSAMSFFSGDDKGYSSISGNSLTPYPYPYP